MHGSKQRVLGIGRPLMASPSLVNKAFGRGISSSSYWLTGLLSVALAGLSGCGDDEPSNPFVDSSSTSSALQSTETTSTSQEESTTTTTSTTSSPSTSSSESSSSVPTSSGSQSTQSGVCEGNFRCVSAIPTDWKGPIARRPKMPTVPNPICAGSYPFTEIDPLLGSEPEYEAATCSACSCAAPKDVRCQESDLSYFKDDGCAELLTTDKAIADDCSLTVNKTGSARGIKVSVPEIVAGSGSCKAVGGFVTKTDPSWKREEKFCRSRDVGKLSCSDQSQVCVPKPSSEFLGGICIYREGDHNCPAGDYQTRLVRYRSFNDQRGCSACGCGTPEGPMACKADLLLFKDNSCSMKDLSQVDESVTVQDADSCIKLLQFSSSVPFSAWLDTKVTGLGMSSCPASGGMPNGEVTGGNPVTICCTATP